MQQLAIALGVAAVIGIVGWSLLEWRQAPRALVRSDRVFVPLPPQACSEGVERVLATWPNARSVLRSPEDETVAVRTHTSARGFGEDVTVKVIQTDGGSIVDVRSAPASWTTVIDYGKNRENVRLVRNAILARFGGTAVDRDA